MIPIILFDFDNTIANTESLREIRETASYDKLNEDTLRHVKAYRPVPDLLKSIRQAGVKIGIVTNSGRTYLNRVLEHLELENAFDVTITYTDVKRDGMKPSPKGIQLALSTLGITPSPEIIYIGDENHDHEAAYKAGVTPVMPTWATKKPVSISPALEMNSAQVLDYLKNPQEYQLFAERSAELGSANFPRQGVYFLPLDDSANVVTIKEEMTAFCLGRYYSQKAAVTAWLHERHALSKEIQRKEVESPFAIPDHWVDMLVHTIRHGAHFALEDMQGHFDVITVIPAKKGKDPRLERLLDSIAVVMSKDTRSPAFYSDVFYYVDDAQSQKLLRRDERSNEAQRALQMNGNRVQELSGKNVLIIDDVTTTGSTLHRGRSLTLSAGASKVLGVAIAKTVSIMEDERRCPKCGRPMKVRKSGSGVHFWGCSGYTSTDNKCAYTEPLLKKQCPKCGREMRINANRTTGQQFWSCTGWKQTPACNHSMDIEPHELPS